MSQPEVARVRRVVACGANGQPRTFRLEPANARQASYRPLALAILGLDVASVADELRSSRRRLVLHAA
jgi:hypothetical protein